MSIFRNALLWGSQNKWLEGQFRRRGFAKKAISKFMPGENIDAALTAAATLGGQDIGTIATQLGENVNSKAEVDAVVDHYLSVLQGVADRNLDTHISVKLTQLGLDIDADMSFDNLERLVVRAQELGNFFWIDMEASEYVDVTLEHYKRIRAKHPNVGVCVQSYLFRTENDVASLLDAGACIRLVKGAYNEPPGIAYARKKDVDESYFKLARRMIEHAAATPGAGPEGKRYPHAMGTHDLSLIQKIGDTARELGAPSDAYEVTMLYGIRAGEQQRLAAASVPTRVLVSYGEAWFPWYMRRLAERPANVGFVIRSMMWN